MSEYYGFQTKEQQWEDDTPIYALFVEGFHMIYDYLFKGAIPKNWSPT